jgi:hypothetical protein
LSDIFREVEEDVRRDRLEKIWKQYGYALIAAAVLVLAGVGGWVFWKQQQAAANARLSDSFAAAQRISDPGKAGTAFAEIARTGKGSYALLAKISQANALNAVGQPGAAVTLYKEVAAADSSEIGAVARLRAAWIMAATVPRKELEDLVAPLNTDESAWQPLAREVLAFADYRGARVKQATEAYRALSEDAKAPEGLRLRARAMVTFLDNGAGADFGTVPATAEAPLPPALPLPPLPAAPGQ